MQKFRKIIEVFDMEVTWNSKPKAVNIKSGKTEELDDEIQEIMKVLEDKIIFDNDISIFT